MLFSKIIKKKFDEVLGRYDGEPAQYYFSPKDFPNIKSEPFDIEGDHHVMLKGFFYYYDKMNPDRMIIFDHGIGAGHFAYLKEIEYLVRHGYTVYSYDHTGCVSTGGSGILGFAQGVNDLDHVLTALKKDPRFIGKKWKLMGHSWGAYSAMNVSALHPEVTHVVSLAGFLSARSLVEQYIPKMFLKYSDEVMDRERQHNPKYTDMDARDSLKKSRAKLLHLQSHDDKKVLFELGYEPLSKALSGRADTTFIALDHRNHDPQRTDAAAAAHAQMMEEMNQLKKKKKLDTRQEQEAFQKSHDWNVIYQQDPEIWDKILKFLEN